MTTNSTERVEILNEQTVDISEYLGHQLSRLFIYIHVYRVLSKRIHIVFGQED
jgi:hypothetical protein